MTGRSWIVRGLTLVAAMGAVAAMPLSAAAQTLDIEGLWLVQVQLRNCQTQAPLGAPFNSLVSFIAGGSTVEATEAPAFAPGQRPPAHGRWARLGPRTFSQQMLSLIAAGPSCRIPSRCRAARPSPRAAPMRSTTRRRNSIGPVARRPLDSASFASASDAGGAAFCVGRFTRTGASRGCRPGRAAGDRTPAARSRRSRSRSAATRRWRCGWY
jgi:hypothetical protein